MPSKYAVENIRKGTSFAIVGDLTENGHKVGLVARDETLLSTSNWVHCFKSISGKYRFENDLADRGKGFGKRVVNREIALLADEAYIKHTETNHHEG